MPNLEQEQVHLFWDSYDRRVIYRILTALGTAEQQWSIDDEPELEPYIIALGRAIDKASSLNISKENIFVRVLSMLQAPRAMRVLQSLDSLKPGTASKLLMYAEQASKESSSNIPDKHAKLFLKRNLIFERMQLLSRVFAPQRISLIIKALEPDR